MNTAIIILASWYVVVFPHVPRGAPRDSTPTVQMKTAYPSEETCKKAQEKEVMNYLASTGRDERSVRFFCVADNTGPMKTMPDAQNPLKQK